MKVRGGQSIKQARGRGAWITCMRADDEGNVDSMVQEICIVERDRQSEA